ncbi:hypothetical protein V6Z11_A07G077200 [Gossypium hirsutum]
MGIKLGYCLLALVALQCLMGILTISKLDLIS